jgi:hypothetical protein
MSKALSMKNTVYSINEDDEDDNSRNKTAFFNKASIE